MPLHNTSRESPPLDSATLSSLKNASQIGAKEITADNLEDALSVIRNCFPIAADQAGAETTYRRYISGERSYFSTYQDRSLDLIHYAVFYKGDAAVGVVGLYRLEGDQDRLHMGWFGVNPEYRKSNAASGEVPVSRQIMEYTESVARKLGATKLAAFTEDSAENRPAHSFYERNGFSIVDRYNRKDEEERLYQKEI